MNLSRFPRPTLPRPEHPLPEGCVIAALALSLLFCACVVVPALALHSLARRVGDWECERIERDW